MYNNSVLTTLSLCRFALASPLLLSLSLLFHNRQNLEHQKKKRVSSTRTLHSRYFVFIFIYFFFVCLAVGSYKADSTGIRRNCMLSWANLTLMFLLEIFFCSTNENITTNERSNCLHNTNWCKETPKALLTKHENLPQETSVQPTQMLSLSAFGWTQPQKPRETTLCWALLRAASNSLSCMTSYIQNYDRSLQS